MNTNKGCTWFIIGIIVVAIPVVVNFICLKDLSFPIVGDGEQWMGFFGSYFGGIISSGIALLIFFQTLGRTTKERKYNNRKEDINSMTIDLKDVVGALNITFLVNKAEEYAQQDIDKAPIIKDLNERETLIRNTFNLFRLRYDSKYKRNEKYNAFVNEYRRCSGLIINGLDELKNNMVVLNTSPEDAPACAQAANAISQLLRQMQEHVDDDTHVFEVANTFIESEFEKLETLDKELNGE